MGLALLNPLRYGPSMSSKLRVLSAKSALVASALVLTSVSAVSASELNQMYVATNASGYTCQFQGIHHHSGGSYYAGTVKRSVNCTTVAVRVRVNNVTSATYTDPSQVVKSGSYTSFQWSQHGAIPTGSTNIYWGATAA